MRKIFVSLALVASTFVFYNCKDSTTSESKNLTREISFSKQGELTLTKAGNDSVIAALDIEIADDEYKTQTGLMYRHSMEPEQGMLFIFPDSQQRSFYMKNTEFPLDIIYFNSNKEVVSIQKNAQPFNPASLPSEAPAQFVLEVNAGLTEKWNLQKGDFFRFTKN